MSCVSSRYQELLATTGEPISAAILTLAMTLDARSCENKSGLLTVKQAAEAMAVSERTIRELVASGKLPCDRIGSARGAIRFSPADIESYRQGTRGASDFSKMPDDKRRRLLKLQ